jgi:rhodanese-related sulfurtransferase/glutaredoxin
MIDNIINFLTTNQMLSIVFIVAIISYVIFETVNWLSSGSIERQCKIEANQLISLFNHNKALIIDTRAKEAYQAGHIVDSINITATECNNQNSVIKSNANKPIIIVCDTGKTAINTAINLRKNGIKEVFYLNGGINAWLALNMPLVKTKQNNNNLNNNIIIYTKPNCAYCLSAKNLLNNKGLKYKEIPSSANAPEFAKKKLPQIVINKQNIGDFDALKQLNDSGELDKLLKNI